MSTYSHFLNYMGKLFFQGSEEVLNNQHYYDDGLTTHPEQTVTLSVSKSKQPARGTSSERKPSSNPLKKNDEIIGSLYSNDPPFSHQTDQKGTDSLMASPYKGSCKIARDRYTFHAYSVSSTKSIEHAPINQFHSRGRSKTT